MSAPPDPSDVVTRHDNAFSVWIDAFPVDAVRDALVELEERRNVLDQQIEKLREGIELWQRLQAMKRRAEAPAEDEVRPPRSPSKRVAALRLLQRYPGRQMPLSEIRLRLVQAGEIEDNDKDYHALQVAMSNAVKRGEIERIESGIYAFIPDDYGLDWQPEAEDAFEASTLTNVQSGGGDGS